MKLAAFHRWLDACRVRLYLAREPGGKWLAYCTAAPSPIGNGPSVEVATLELAKAMHRREDLSIAVHEVSKPAVPLPPFVLPEDALDSVF